MTTTSTCTARRRRSCSGARGATSATAACGWPIPVLLAERVLRDQPEWTRERILHAMEGGTSQRVNLTRPLQVILFYLTAVVMPEDGSVRFAEDIYGHDGKLTRALARP